MTDELFFDDTYKNQLDAESLLLMHMNRIAIYRDTDRSRYCSGIETLILLCPRNIRDNSLTYMKEHGMNRRHPGSIPDEILIQYDDLLIYINEQLEKNKMIWKKRSVRTYE